MSSYRVTVGIPVTNEIDEFQLAVRSVYAQSEADWELIIVCDGASQEVRRAAAAIDDPRVRVVDDGVSRGLPARLNQVTEMAQADHIARLDADDVMHSERLTRQLAAFDQARDLDVLGTRAFLIDERGRTRGVFREPPLPNSRVGFLRSNAFTHPTVMFRRSWAIKFPYRSEWVRTEDKELWLRANPSSVFMKLPDRLTFYRVPTTLSRKKQALTAKFDRKLYRSAARAEGVGFSRRMRYLLESHAKQTVFQASVALGASRALYNRKLDPLSEAEAAAADAHLLGIASVPVPGW